MGGKTQQRLSDRCQLPKNKRRYKYSFDASSFDQTLPGFCMSLMFDSVIVLFAENEFTKRRILMLRKYELTAGYFHKFLKVIKRRIGGLLSGSGLTNQLGTFCSLFMTIVTLLSMGYTISQIESEFDFMVTGDDLVIFSNNVIDYEAFINKSSENFGIVYNLNTDLIGSPTKDVFEFAGST